MRALTRDWRYRPTTVPGIMVTLVAILLAACGGGTSGGAGGTDGGDEDIDANGSQAQNADQPAGTEAAVRLLMPGTAFQLQVHAVVYEGNDFFDTEGIDVETTRVRSPRDVMQGLAAGAGDIGVTTPDTAIQAQLEGVDVVVIAGLASRPPWDLVVAQDVDSVEDLRGKKISTVQRTGAATTMLEVALEGAGLSPDSYDLVVSGAPPGRLAALESGAVAATFLPPPASIIAEEQKGFKRLLSFSEYVDAPSIVLIANRSWAAENKDTAVAFLEALLAATEWVYQPSNLDSAYEATNAFSPLDRDVFDEMYEALAVDAEIFPRDLSIELESTVELMRRAGAIDKKLDADRFLDRSYQEAATRSGD